MNRKRIPRAIIPFYERICNVTKIRLGSSPSLVKRTPGLLALIDFFVVSVYFHGRHTRKNLWHTLISLQWRHNGYDGVSNHQPHDCFAQPIFLGANQRRHQISASLTFARGIHWWLMDSPHKGPATRKMPTFDDIIMTIIHMRLGMSSIYVSSMFIQRDF